jgi:hypothetical protein
MTDPWLSRVIVGLLIGYAVVMWATEPGGDRRQ